MFLELVLLVFKVVVGFPTRGIRIGRSTPVQGAFKDILISKQKQYYRCYPLPPPEEKTIDNLHMHMTQIKDRGPLIDCGYYAALRTLCIPA